MRVSIAGAEGARLCEPVLRSIPEWFGVEESTLSYIEDAGRLPTWVAWTDAAEEAAGFVTIRRHYHAAAEVHCIAVHRRWHGKGVGTALLAHVEEHLRFEGVRFLQVKTMGPSRPNAEYAMTLRFYLSRGFAELEELTGLWPGIPTLILVKSL